MDKFKEILDKLKMYKYPSLYILLFIVCVMFMNSILMFFILSILLSAILILLNKDSVLTTIAIGDENSGRHQQALNSLEKLVKRNTKNATAYAYYGNMLLMDGNPKEAIVILEKGLTLKCNSIIHKNLVLALSSSYWVDGDVKKGIALLEDLIAQYSYINHHVYSTLGYLYLLDNNIEDATKYTSLALEDDETSSSALDNMGQIKFTLGEYDEAKDYFKKALAQRDNLADSLYYLGVIYLNEDTKDLTQAKNYLERARACNVSVMNTITDEMIEAKLQELDKISKKAIITNNFTIDNIDKLHEKYTGVDFPKLIASFRNMGIIKIEFNIRDNTRNYLNDQGREINTDFVGLNIEISETTNIDKAKELLLIHQQGESDFDTFIEDIAKCGAYKWVINVVNSVCAYYGLDDEVMFFEEIPKVDIEKIES